MRLPKTKHYKRLRGLALLTAILLIVNIFSFFWVSGSGVSNTKAAAVTTGFCMTICPVAGCTIPSCSDLLSPSVSTVLGCTDPQALNYDSSANTDDGSCQYPEAETTIIRGGGPPILPFEIPLGLVSPEEIKRVLIDSESDQEIYNKIYQINNQVIGSRLIAEAGPVVVPYSQTYLNFYGKTNIANAIIIITLTSPQNFYATTFANDQGYWQWTVPEILIPSLHSITIMAISPSNAAVRQVYRTQFLIELPAKEITPPAVITPPTGVPILPSVELPPIEITKNTYALNVKVIPAQEPLRAGGQVSIVADVTSFQPLVEEEITLQFTIRDETGKIIFIDQSKATIEDILSVIKRLGLKSDRPAGNYVVTVEMKKDDITYLTSVSFELEEGEEVPFFALPGRITLSRTQAQQGLFSSLTFLSLLLTFFMILLWREYQRAKREIQITGKDLWEAGTIT